MADAEIMRLQGELAEARAAIRETWQAAAEWHEEQERIAANVAKSWPTTSETYTQYKSLLSAHRQSAAHFRAKAEASRG